MNKSTVLIPIAVLIAVVGAGCGAQKKAPESPASPSRPSPVTAPSPTTPSTPSNPPASAVTSTSPQPAPTTEVPIPSPSNSPMTSAPTSTPSSTKGSKLTITQWGVSLKLVRGITDVYYVIKPVSGGKLAAHFSTRTLMTKAGDACGTEEGPLGMLVRTKSEADKPANAIKVGDYYYYYAGPEKACSDDADIKALADKQAKLMEQAAATVYAKEE